MHYYDEVCCEHYKISQLSTISFNVYIKHFNSYSIDHSKASELTTPNPTLPSTMAKFSLIAAILGSASYVSASPIAARQASCGFTPSASVDWYQGSLSFGGTYAQTNSTCGSVKVSSGTLTPGTCTELYTYGMGIHQSPYRSCTFKLWTGTSTCNGGKASTEISVPQGSGTTCINTGDLDGGKFYPASGIYTCS